MARPSTAESLKAAAKSWRVGAVTLLSFSSGLPYGLVVYAVPAWLAMAGVDIKTIGLVTLARAPYAFKFVWSPLMDRFRLPWFGRKRGWILAAQCALALLTFALASQAASPKVGIIAALCVLIAFASASQDIAVDAYAVDTLLPDEQGLAVGARIAMYRLAMYVSRGIAVTVAGLVLWGGPIGWGPTLSVLALLFVALMPVAARAPEPEVQVAPPRSMREAVWEPFVGFFQKSRALEIAFFILLYKLADNLAVALVQPFLLELHYDAVDVGIASGTVGLVFTIVGTFVGGFLTTRLGVGRALWLFGILQCFAGAGYAVVAMVGVHRPLMYASVALEAGASGMGTGAFSVLLLRLTQKRFSATQYALFSSVFAMGATIAGPIAGAVADAVGWRDFFLFTIACGVPGLLMLQRFVPWATRDLPEEGAEMASAEVMGAALSRSGLVMRGALAAVAGAALGLFGNALLAALKQMKGGKAFDLVASLLRTLDPVQTSDWFETAGAVVFGLVVGFGLAAYLAARRGIRAEQAPS